MPKVSPHIVATASQMKKTTLKSINLKAAATGNAPAAYKRIPMIIYE